MTVSLADVVAQVESAGNQFAYRFEPAQYQRLLQTDDQTQNATGASIRLVEKIHGCSPDSARVLLASSWGRHQLMGFNIWSGRYTGMAWHFLDAQSDQDVLFDEFVEAIGIDEVQMADASWLMTDQAAALEFATRYNGPGQPTVYLGLLQAAYVKLSGTGV
jgi:hypothetical protein